MRGQCQHRFPLQDEGLKINLTTPDIVVVSVVAYSTMTTSNQKPEVILILMPWEIPADFVEHIKTLSPGIEVHIYFGGRHDKVVPSEISEEAWKKVTVLFTWNALPPKDLVPNLEYVQLLSAGCNHVADDPLFKDTDVSFCTANGVHP